MNKLFLCEGWRGPDSPLEGVGGGPAPLHIPPLEFRALYKFRQSHPGKRGCAPCLSPTSEPDLRPVV